MNHSRRKAIVLFAATATGVALNGSPGRAAATPPELVWVFSSTDRTGRTAIAARSDNDPITYVSARILTEQGGSELMQLTSFSLLSGSPTYGAWQSDPIMLPEIGNYWVEWTLRTVGGGEVTHADVFRYWRYAEITDLVASPETVDAWHQTIVVTGHVAGRHPVTNVLTPLAGIWLQAGVNYTSGGGNSQIVELTAGPEGDFTFQTSLTASAKIWAGATVNDPTRFAHYSPTREVEVRAIATATRLTADVSSLRFDLGKQVTVAGKLEQLVDGNWLPLAGREVGVDFLDDRGVRLYGQVLPPPITDEQGSLRVSIKPLYSGHYELVFNPPGFDATDRFYTESRGSTDAFVVLYGLPFARFTVQPVGEYHWEVTGYLAMRPEEAQIEIQAGFPGTGSWQALPTTVISTGYHEPSWGWQFKAQIQVITGCFVRAYRPETDEWQSAVSNAVYVPSTPAPRRELADARVPAPRRW